MAEAVDWFVRLSSGEATDEDVRALDAWRAAKPEHDAAFRRLARLQPVARALKAQPVLSRRAMLTGTGTAMAGLVAFALARPPLGMWPSLAELMADHRTGVGQRYAFAPIVGVHVEMNSRTSLSLFDSDQALELVQGEAYISVDRPQRFRIRAQGAYFSTASARLNVETLAGGIRLSCLDGSVDCKFGESAETIGPNQEWRLNAQGRTQVRTGDTRHMADWRRGWLTFDAAPLGDVVEQLNRYRSSPIMLADSRLGGRPVSGVFQTAEINDAVEQLQQLLGLRVRALPGNVILLG